MTTEATFVVLFCVATAVAIAVRNLRMPYTVALVIVGLGLGALGLIAPPHLTRDLLFTIFLPGLLFEAAFHLDLTAFRRTWRSAVSLAVPGVAASIAITAAVLAGAGWALGMGEHFDWRIGVVLGAILAATDPVAVTAVFREVRVPARLAALVEGESLLNDGTGVVFFSVVLAYVTGAESSIVGSVRDFVVVAGGGVVLGIGIGWLLSLVIRRIDEAMIEIALTTIAAYGSFALAERAGVSGVLATVVAGVLCGREGRDRGMSDASRAATESFWQYIAFALNSIVFLLIGFEFDARTFLAVWPQITIAFVAILVARAVVVSALFGMQGPLREPMPGRWSVILVWGGLRGALCMVLALALPAELPGRELLIEMTIGVVILSVIVQGATMPLLVERLRVAQSADDAAAVISD